MCKKNKTKKIAIITNGPTFFDVPFFKIISSNNKFRLDVFFGVKNLENIDPEMGKLKWGLSLYSGYSYEFIPKSFLKCFFFLKNKVFKNQYDIVIVNGYNKKFNFLSLLIGAFSKTKTVFRGDSILIYKRNIFKKFLKYIILKPLFLNTSAFFAMSSLSKKYLIHYGAKPEKIFFWPYVFDINNFLRSYKKYSFKKKIIKKNLDLKNKLVFLAVTKLIPREGVLDLIKAFNFVIKKNKNIRLLVIGDGFLKEKINNYIKDNNLSKFIKILGYKSYNELPKFYAISDVFIHPVLYGPWEISIQEALICSNIIITSDKVGAGYDFVKEGFNGCIYKSGNVKDLSYKIKNIIKKEKKDLEKMKKNSYLIHNNKKWNYDFVFKEWEKLINFLTKN